MMTKKWLFPVIFILGFLLGAFCFKSYLQRALFIEKANQLTSGREYSMFNTMLFSIEAGEADKQLNNSNKEVTIYALTRTLDNIDLLTVNNVYPTCAHRAYKLAKYHLRLAELYSEKMISNRKSCISYQHNNTLRKWVSALKIPKILRKSLQ